MPPSVNSNLSLPPASTASGTDPAHVWAGEAVSVAGSRVSVGPAVRRAQAVEEYECAREERLQWFLANEEEQKAKVEGELAIEDLKSEAASRARQPWGSAAAEEVEVVRRRLLELEHEKATLTRVLAAKDVVAAPPRSPSSAASGERRFATVSSKFKADKPKAWTGRYDWVEREGWIKSASLYLVSLELELDAEIDEYQTPRPFFLIRSLFSPDVSHGASLSPQAWFDARNGREPFRSVQDVFKALRSHWADDHAAKVALARYRAARQGSLRARDFGATVDSLADACIDRTIDDLDRKTTFVQGLNPAVQDFVKTQLASRKALGRTDESFEDVVKVAALTDGLAAFASKKVIPVPSSLPRKGALATDVTVASPSLPKASGASLPVARGTNWIEAVVKWQAEHPLADRSKWADSQAKASSKPVRCYNCGNVGTHFSRACTASRKDPTVVILAAFHKLSSAKSLPPSSPPSLAPSSDDRFEELEGKEDEE
ncbi:hypothetical protein JCM1840_002261 [Sporobolomyces johnsonii]